MTTAARDAPDKLAVEAVRIMERDLRLMLDFNLNAVQIDFTAARVKDYDKLAEGNPESVDFSLLNRDLAACRRVGTEGVGLIFSARASSAALRITQSERRTTPASSARTCVSRAARSY